MRRVRDFLLVVSFVLSSFSVDAQFYRYLYDGWISSSIDKVLMLDDGNYMHVGYSEDSVQGQWTSKYGVSSFPFQPCPCSRANPIVHMRQFGGLIDYINKNGEVYSSDTWGRRIQFRNNLGQTLDPSAQYFTSKVVNDRVFLTGRLNGSGDYVVDEWYDQDSLRRLYQDTFTILDISVQDSLQFLVGWTGKKQDLYKLTNWQSPQVFDLSGGAEVDARRVHILNGYLYVGATYKTASMSGHKVVLQKYTLQGEFLWEKGIDLVWRNLPGSIQLLSDFRNDQIALLVGEKNNLLFKPCHTCH